MDGTNITIQPEAKFHDVHQFGKGLTKLDIAKIQIVEAIKMLFNESYPVLVHSVISCAYQIVRDLGEKNQTDEFLQLADHIKPGHEKEFWSHINKTWSFQSYLTLRKK